MATRAASAAVRLRARIEIEQRRLAHGERPLFHVCWTEAAGGAVDVTINELPIVHLFVPDPVSVLDGARLLIARTLGAESDAFDVTTDPAPSSGA